MTTADKPQEKKQAGPKLTDLHLSSQRPGDAPIIFYLNNGEQVRCTAAKWRESKYEHIIQEENSDIIIPKGAVIKIRAWKK